MGQVFSIRTNCGLRLLVRRPVFMILAGPIQCQRTRLRYSSLSWYDPHRRHTSLGMLLAADTGCARQSLGKGVVPSTLRRLREHEFAVVDNADSLRRLLDVSDVVRAEEDGRTVGGGTDDGVE